MPIIKICQVCQNEFKVKPCHATIRKNCSKECQIKAQIKEKKQVKCLSCGNVFQEYDNIHRENAKFCNKKCMGEYVRGEKHWNYHGEGYAKQKESERSKKTYQKK